MNGWGFSSHAVTHVRMSFSRAWTLWSSERRWSCSVRYANHLSTWLIGLEHVGVLGSATQERHAGESLLRLVVPGWVLPGRQA
jgi:hypothetical protein